MKKDRGFPATGCDPPPMKISRLFQPRNPQFWLLIVLNALSTAISFILRAYELPLPVALVLAGFAVVNAVLGLRIAWRLMSEPPVDQIFSNESCR